MDHTRHIEIYDVSNEVVTLIGAGGIGATTAIALAKMGISGLVVYDMDSVGTENLATQLHRLSDVGKFKVDAISNAISTYANDVTVFPRVERVTAQTKFDTRFVICAVDNIHTRQEVWRSVQYPIVRYFIDARMSAEEFHLYTVDLKSDDAVKRYNDMIWQESDETVPELACTMKSTMYCSFLSAAWIGHAVKTLAMGKNHPFATIINMPKFLMLSQM